MTEKPENQIDNATKTRLAGQTMQPATTPRCWYCWAITPWWDCNCPDATLAKAGKLAKPRVVEDPRTGRMVIILPEYVVQRHAAAGRIWDNGSRLERWKDVQAQLTADPVNTKPVHKSAVDRESVDTVDTVDSAEKRKAYKREWMAKKRDARKYPKSAIISEER